MASLLPRVLLFAVVFASFACSLEAANPTANAPLSEFSAASPSHPVGQLFPVSWTG